MQQQTEGRNNGDISMEERRRLNIIRNEEFLNSLLSDSSLKIKRKQENLDSENNELLQRQIHSDKPPESLRDILSEKFPCRSNAIESICHFLDNSVFGMPPLLLHGPTGTGKTSLCEFALSHIVSTPVVSIRCSSFTSSTQILTHLWLSVLSSITNHNIQYHNYKCDILDNIDHTSHIKIKSYNELVNKISKLVNSQYQILCSMKDRSNGLQSTMDNNSIDNTHLDNRNKSSYNICIIYFDGIDSVDSYDNTLSYQLLHIGKFCQHRIKVLSSRLNYPRMFHDINDVLLLYISPYSDADIILVVSQLCVNDILCNNGNNNADYSTVKQTVTEILSTVLFHVSMVSRDINELKAIVMHMYEERVQYIENQLISNKDKAFSRENIITTANRNISKHRKILFDKYSLNEILPFILNQPAVNIVTTVKESTLTQNNNTTNSLTFDTPATSSMNAIEKNYISRYEETAYSNIVANEGVAKENDDDNDVEESFHNEVADTCAQKVMKEFIFEYKEQLLKYPVNIDTLCGKGWCVELPYLSRVVLIASYIASSNPQDSDKYTFGFNQKGRRKKARMGNDETAEAVAQKSDGVNHLPRSFNIERLLAISLQIYPAMTISNIGYEGESLVTSAYDKNMSYWSMKKSPFYNESALLTTVNGLVRKQFLIQISNNQKSNITDVFPILYVCNLTGANAETLSRSLSFPLQDYLQY